MLDFYSGSRFFEPLSNFVGLSVDQFNFLICQFVAMGIGHVFRKYIAPHLNAWSKHCFELFVGIMLTSFCFGRQVLYLLVQSGLTYIMLRVLPDKKGRVAIFIFTLSYLSMAHIFRLYFDYGGYTLDITGPLMIQTQKLSALAFNLSDGMRLNVGRPLRQPHHEKHAIRKMPTLLEFFSYLMSFHNVLVGPFVFFSDYCRFIESREEEMLNSDEEKELYRKNKASISSANHEIKGYLIEASIYMALTMFVAPFFPPEYMISEDCLNSSLFYKICILTVTAFLIRQKYYIAWSLASAANLSAGFGFSGFDPSTKQPAYEIVRNFKFASTEMGNSMKIILDNWNIGTLHWLRESVYDRVPRNVGTFAVFTASAFWHGFYPGYYMTFISCAVFTIVARVARRKLRPHIVFHNLNTPYDVLTHLVGMLALNYCAVPFFLLECSQSIKFWWSTYFCVHFVALIIYLAFPYIPRVNSECDSSIEKKDQIKSEDKDKDS